MLMCNIFDGKEVRIEKLSMTTGPKRDLHKPN
jgi:hypothetical protein